MKISEQLKTKYEHYAVTGHTVFAVTLSTFVTSNSFAQSDRMRHLWDNHFIYRVLKELPFAAKRKLDHDFVVERSPAGCFHYHGFLAVPAELKDRLWRDGALKVSLRRALESFEKRGKYRPLCVNEFEIEPVESATKWAKYITKTSDFVTTLH